MKKDTLLARTGRDPARHQGMVNTPVFRTSTVIFPDRETYEARGGDDFKKVRYGLSGTPTTFALEEAVAQMEGGHAAVALPSGLAAIVVALWACLPKRQASEERTVFDHLLNRVHDRREDLFASHHGIRFGRDIPGSMSGEDKFKPETICIGSAG